MLISGIVGYTQYLLNCGGIHFIAVDGCHGFKMAVLFFSSSSKSRSLVGIALKKLILGKITSMSPQYLGSMAS